mgnify:CR=1
MGNMAKRKIESDWEDIGEDDEEIDAWDLWEKAEMLAELRVSQSDFEDEWDYDEALEEEAEKIYLELLKEYKIEDGC